MSNMEDIEWHILELSNGALRAACLKTVYELKIQDVFEETSGFLSASEICQELRQKNNINVYDNHLERVLRFLACFNLFQEKMVNDCIVFKKTEFFDTKFIQMPLLTAVNFGYKLTDYLTQKSEGKTLMEYCRGYNVWESLEKKENQLELETLQQTMCILTKDIEKSVSHVADVILSRSKQDAVIVDVGGMDGKLLSLINSRLPQLKCINFDLATVIERAKPPPNIKMISGDMFKVETIPKCDIIIMKNIIHSWNDDNCVKILSNCNSVLSDDGLLLVIAYHLNVPGEEVEKSKEWWVKGLDLEMMMMFRTSKQRTIQEHQKLFEKALFNLIEVVDLGPPKRRSNLLVGVKLKK